MATVTKPEIIEEILQLLQPQVEEEKQVVVHCCFPATFFDGTLIRIWSSTFLVDDRLAHKSNLIHHENISLYPDWTEIPSFRDFWFTLIFSGLPKDCKTFDLQEIIPEEGGFHVKNIKRNGSDVYRVKLT